MNFLPGWNSIETTTWFHDLLEKSSLFLLAVVVVALALAYLYGQRRDFLSEEAARVARTARVAVPVKPTAETVRQPEIAQRQAAIQDSEKAVAANQGPVEEIKLPGAEGKIASAPKQAPIAETQAAAVDKPAATIQPPSPVPGNQESGATGNSTQESSANIQVPKAAPRKEQIAEAMDPAAIDPKKSNDRVQPEGPRHLGADQKARLQSFLETQPKGRLTIRINPAIPDASNYGVELAQFFERVAGWSVRIDNSPIAGTDHGGLWLALRSAEAIPPSTGALHAALAHAHVPVRAQPVWDANGPAFNEIWLVVGKNN